jgi:hypothetical protein
MKSKLILILYLLIWLSPVIGQTTIVFTGEKKNLEDNGLFFLDKTKKLNILQVKDSFETKNVIPSVLDLDYNHLNVWIKIDLINNSETPYLMGVFENPLIDSIEFYTEIDTLSPKSYSFLGNGFKSKANDGTFQRFKIYAPIGIKQSYYFCVRSTEQLLLPFAIFTADKANSDNNFRDLIYGAFMGVVMVMLFYNLFVYASTLDKNYLYYVLYILFIGLGQIALSGHLYSLILHDFPSIYKSCVVALPAVSGIFAVLFIKHFLQADLFEPKLSKWLNFMMVLYGIAALLRIFGMAHISARMMDVIGLPGATVVFILAFRVYRKGFKSAIYFILAWSVFIIGVVLFVFRNLGFLPVNWLTTYTLPLGAAFEVALLSFALADKINTLERQKREKEKEVLLAALENQRLIKEQNVILEAKVEERTKDLAESNNQLTVAFSDLKAAQSQMVDQEKMASLGQLTAGIAHEINNPINFVTSNISPLRRDIKMIQGLLVNLENLSLSDESIEDKLKMIKGWKEEMEYDYLNEKIGFLLAGIDDGARRTSEIVKGLKVFARNDEESVLNVNLIEGIESTLVILNNQMGKIDIKKVYPPAIFLECFPGKLNQVFLNLISNSIYAVQEKFKDKDGGLIYIEIIEDSEKVVIKCEDNGMGMTEEIQRKIFEPFYTTKPVGQGTGLGMSMVFQIIELHKGRIDVKSKLGEGTIFKLILQKTLMA